MANYHKVQSQIAATDTSPKTPASVDHLTKAAAIEMLRERGVEDLSGNAAEVKDRLKAVLFGAA